MSETSLDTLFSTPVRDTTSKQADAEATTSTSPTASASVQSATETGPARRRRGPYANRGEVLQHADFLAAQRSLKSVRKKIGEALQQYDGVTTLMKNPKQMQPHHQEQLRALISSLGQSYSFLPSFFDRVEPINASDSPSSLHPDASSDERAPSPASQERHDLRDSPTDSADRTERVSDAAEPTDSAGSPVAVALQDTDPTASTSDKQSMESSTGKPAERAAEPVEPTGSTPNESTNKQSAATESAAAYESPTVTFKRRIQRAAARMDTSGDSAPSAAARTPSKQSESVFLSTEQRMPEKRRAEDTTTATIPARKPLAQAKVSAVYSKLSRLGR